MQLAAIAVARGLAALSPQGVERAWEERLASEARIEQARQKFLGLAELTAEGAKALVHGLHRGGGKGICI